MAETATLNVRMDADTKKAFTDFCEELGMSASALMNVFARTVVRNQEVPFAMTTKAASRAGYRSVFPGTEDEIFEAIDRGASVPLQERTTMDDVTQGR